MKKVLLISLALVALMAPVGLSAANPFEYEDATVGQTNLNIGASVGWGIGVDAGVDFILGKFDIPEFPIEWGIGARGLAEFGWGGGFAWGASALWTLHKGFSFGEHANFDFYVGIGAGVGGYTNMMYGMPFGVGFSTFDGLAWELTENLWLQVEYGGIYGWNVATSLGSLGLRISL